jgi:hypothetical protein
MSADLGIARPPVLAAPAWRISAWSFADAQGLFIGRIYAGSEEFLALNTPEGCTAVEGRHDPLSARWDGKAQQVVDYQPPAPADDELRTWAWDKEARRWVSQPTLAALKLAQTAAIAQALAVEDARSIRPMSELLVALADGQQPTQEAKAALEQIEERKAALREELRVIDAARSETEFPTTKR